MSRPAYLFAPQAHLPGPPISNAEMEAHLGQFGDRPSRSRALVLKRNGIKNRHYARTADGSWHSDLAGMSATAAQQSLQCAGHIPQDVGLIAGSCTLGDHLVPGCASQVHARLARDDHGWQGAELASYQSVCAASAMAIKGAAAQVRLGEHDLALVTGGEFASRYLHAGQYSHLGDQMEALPFEADFLRFTLSDGGGAALIGARTPKGIPAFKIHWIDIRSYADRFPICMSGGAARCDGGGWTPWTAFAHAGEAASAGAFTLQQDFSLLDSLVAAWVHHYLDLINSGKLARSDFDWVVSHYSAKSLQTRALKLLDAAGAGVPEDLWYSNLSQTGNIGTASIFALLAGFLETPRAVPGAKILAHVPESGQGLNALMLLELMP